MSPRRYAPYPGRSGDGGLKAQLEALANIVAIAERGKLSKSMEASLKKMAAKHAKEHKLFFDGTIRSAIRMVEHADRMLRDRLELQHKMDMGRMRHFGVGNQRFIQ